MFEGLKPHQIELIRDGLLTLGSLMSQVREAGGVKALVQSPILLQFMAAMARERATEFHYNRVEEAERIERLRKEVLANAGWVPGSGGQMIPPPPQEK
jgi:hypothetical protein